MLDNLVGTLNKTIGYPKEKIRLLDRFRRQRAAGLYDGSFEPSAAEVQALIDAATELESQLTGWLERERPELSKQR